MYPSQVTLHPEQKSGAAGDVTIAQEPLSAWANALLAKLGVEATRATTVVECLVSADLKGVGSHGLSRLGIYVMRLKLGLITPSAEILTVSETPSTLVLDAQSGFGQVAGAAAIDMGMRKAREFGACVITVRNSNHFGMAGFFAERAARQGFIAIVTTNSAARMAPWGASEALFGTNPLAIAVPREGDPILLDMSTSAAALGKIVIAEKAGTSIPEGWALDAEGQATTDPTAALAGTLVPIAGPKGSGLAFMLDILSGVLSGATFGRDVGSLYRDFTRPESCGHFMMLIDISAFMAPEQFGHAVARYIDQLRDSRPIKDGDTVLAPGEIELKRAQQSRASGIRLDQATLRDLTQLGADCGVPFPTT